MPAALVALVVIASAALLAPASYRVPTGTVDFSLDPAWPGGTSSSRWVPQGS